MKEIFTIAIASLCFISLIIVPELGCRNTKNVSFKIQPLTQYNKENNPQITIFSDELSKITVTNYYLIRGDVPKSTSKIDSYIRKEFCKLQVKVDNVTDIFLIFLIETDKTNIQSIMEYPKIINQYSLDFDYYGMYSLRDIATNKIVRIEINCNNSTSKKTLTLHCQM